MAACESARFLILSPFMNFCLFASIFFYPFTKELLQTFISKEVVSLNIGIIFHCWFQTSPEAPGIFILLQKLFRSQSLESLKDVALSKCGFTEDDFKVSPYSRSYNSLSKWTLSWSPKRKTFRNIIPLQGEALTFKSFEVWMGLQ